MKFYQKRGCALIVLILAILFAGYWGISHKPAETTPTQHAELLDVKYQQWICDDANALSGKTESVVVDYNDTWDSRYYGIVAVASVKSVSGWEIEDYAAALGSKWGLGANDMLLLLVTKDDPVWYVAVGDNVNNTMTDVQQMKLKQAIDKPFYSGKYDEAVTAFYRQADVFYGQTNLGGSNGSWSGDQSYEDYYPQAQQSADSGIHLGGVIVMLIAFFVVWIILDRLRYNRYRRRYMGPTVVTPVVTYYPIFWGRTSRPAPPRPPQSPVGQSGGYAPTRPPRPTQSRPTAPNRPARRPSAPSRPRGFGGSRGGINRSGGSRGGFGGGGFGGRHR
ncbi:MAG: TPM domain-containing protein [Clostridiales bacterium]|nr:TPM domain-containing protein [Candidatus Cacconaster stercorequi]